MNMSPVPNQPEKNQVSVDSLDSPQFVVAAHSSSESEEGEWDEEGPIGMGYQMIPQEPDNMDDEDEDEDDDEGTEAAAASTTLDQTPNIDDIIVQHLDQSDFLSAASAQNACATDAAKDEETCQIWNQPRQSQSATAMNQEQVEKIRAAMAGFSLPTVNHPAWSKVIPEEEWKSRLLAKTQTNSKWPPPAEDEGDR